MRMRFLILAALLAATPALAQTALERIEPRLAAAIAEERVFLTCSAANAQMASELRFAWTAMVREARTSLEARDTSLADLAAFDRRTAVEAIVLPPETPAETTATFCDVENAGWLARYQNLQIIYRLDETPLP